MDIDARLDLIALANGIRNDPDTPGGDADLMSYLIGDLCDKRDLPAIDCLTNRRRAVIERFDRDYFAELVRRHGWPESVLES